MTLGAPLSNHSRFPTTAWSLIAGARDCPTQALQTSLAGLCASYWQPVFNFIQRKGIPAEEARDCTQEFFARVIEKKYLRDVDRSKGKFRSFLLVSVTHFLSNRLDAERAEKRGGRNPPLSLDSRNEEGRPGLEPAHFATPEVLFERQWALTVVGRALDRLRASYPADQFGRLKPFLLGEAPHGELTALARDRGMSEGAVKVAVHRMRKHFRQALRDEIAQTVANPELVDQEIRYLITVLGRAGGREV